MELENNVAIEYGHVYEKLANAAENNRFIIMVGSSRSGKTYSILQWLIVKCLEAEKPIRIAVCRSKRTWLKITAFSDFKDILENQFNMWSERDLNKTDLAYTLNGCEWLFLGLDNESGIKKAQGLKCDYVFLNECIDMTYEQYRQITLRNTGKVIMDLNPNCNTNHWLWQHVANRKGAITIKSTYKDNPFLPKEVIENIESYEPTAENVARGTADLSYWKIYGLGEMSVINGLVYPTRIFCNHFPADVTYCYGLDFGYTNDPTTLIRVGTKGKDLYLEEVVYRTGLVNLRNDVQDSIESEFIKHRINKRVPIYCDCAEPKSIDDLKNAGYNVIGVAGGSKSILPGIQVVKKYQMNIIESSMHLINEVENYKWKEDKDGKATNDVVDKFNHALDAVRYAIVSMDSKEFAIVKAASFLGVCNFRMQTNDYKYNIMAKDLEDDDNRKDGMDWLQKNVWHGVS